MESGQESSKPSWRTFWAQAVLGLAFIGLLGVGAVLGTLIFGRGYKRRIAALEAQARQPSINQTINFNVSPDCAEHDRQLRAAIDAETQVKSLEKTIHSLPQNATWRGPHLRQTTGWHKHRV